MPLSPSLRLASFLCVTTSERGLMPTSLLSLIVECLGLQLLSGLAAMSLVDGLRNGLASAATTPLMLLLLIPRLLVPLPVLRVEVKVLLGGRARLIGCMICPLVLVNGGAGTVSVVHLGLGWMPTLLRSLAVPFLAVRLLHPVLPLWLVARPRIIMSRGLRSSYKLTSLLLTRRCRNSFMNLPLELALWVLPLARMLLGQIFMYHGFGWVLSRAPHSALRKLWRSLPGACRQASVTRPVPCSLKGCGSRLASLSKL